MGSEPEPKKMSGEVAGTEECGGIEGEVEESREGKVESGESGSMGSWEEEVNEEDEA